MTFKCGIFLLTLTALIASPVEAFAQDDVNVPKSMVPPSQLAFIREAVSFRAEQDKYTPGTRSYDENSERLDAENHAIALKYQNVIGWVCQVVSGSRNWQWFVTCESGGHGATPFTMKLEMPNGTTFQEKGGIYPGDIIEVNGTFDGHTGMYEMAKNSVYFWAFADHIEVPITVTDWKTLRAAP